MTNWSIGDRVTHTTVDLMGMRKVYFGKVVNILSTRRELVITWDGNNIGATQNVPIGQCLKIWGIDW